MTKVPNILDHLTVMMKEARTHDDKLVLMAAFEICAKALARPEQLAPVTINQNPPPSWPLNLDEWECQPAWEKLEGGGWWMTYTPQGLPIYARRRKARAEQVTLNQEP